MHSADVRIALDEIVDIVFNSGFVDDEYITSAKALVACFVAADLPLIRTERYGAAGDLRAEILMDHLLKETSGFGLSLERRMAFLKAVQAAIQGLFRDQRDSIDELRAEVERLEAPQRRQAFLRAALSGAPSSTDIDEVSEGDL